MFSVPPSPALPLAKACVSHNCDTDSHIKLIFDMTIDDPEWKIPIEFGKNQKSKLVDAGHFVKL